MAKRRRKKNRNKNQYKAKIQKLNNNNVQLSEPEQIGDFTVIEEKIIEPKTTDLSNVTPSKPLDKLSKEKIEIMPQTYVEDTFDFTNNKSEIVIENPVKERGKQYITVDELLSSQNFKNKVERIRKRILHQKSFNFLFDYITFSKQYRTYFIDDETDEIDLILNEIVLIFKKRLRRIELKYQDYQNINSYFESLKSLYNRFNNGEGAIKGKLKEELESTIKLEPYIRRLLF